MQSTPRAALRVQTLLVALALLVCAAPQAGLAQVTAFKQAVAEASARDDALAQFYRGREFEGLWTGAENRNRRNALMAAFEDASIHGLPEGRYDPQAVMQEMRAASTEAEKGRMEVKLSRLFLSYARDVQTGVLKPGNVVSAIRREVPYRPRLTLIQAFEKSNPSGFLRSLPPSSSEYQRLVRAKMKMERQLAQGGWGPVVETPLEAGASGPQVVNLRNRLIAMGFMNRSATQTYDESIVEAVKRYQQANGLTVDGVAGPGTLEEINVPLASRLQNVIVAMERERWINRPRGERHVWVNLTDFTASVVDNGAVTFQTRSVIGSVESDRQSPEFSDVMEFMVINPSWYVPRSITVNEYLPQLKANRHAVSHIDITDRNGRVMNRNNINFAQYSKSTFPYSMRQPPSRGNALGQVKFMFPNKYNIYLHDTPSQSLFSRTVRAFSHGCIRLNDPYDFAYKLLERQTGDPEGYFQSRLQTGREQRVNLDQPVPVHIVYRTAFTSADGQVHYRRDIYDRDSRIWNALAQQGVAIRAVGG